MRRFLLFFKKHRVLTVILIFLVFTGCVLYGFVLYIRISCIPPQDVVPIPSEKIILTCRDGDFIFRKGYGFWSDFFTKFSERDKRFSHFGVLAFREGKWKVIHALADDVSAQGKVLEEDLDSFLHNSERIGIFRLNTPFREKICASKVAEEFIGVPFDWKFDLYNHDRIYCTELCYIILQRAGLEPNVQKKLDSEDYFPIESCYDVSFCTEILVLETKKK